ncbi:hypothetical protein ACS5PJ_20815, partial [Pseudarthrobacter sp. YS3]|uniref:hypothetical protein n=1 Tax=Pseudarthrobacter sp. YS3 TaxID=3453718 RepID=UPI003EEE0E0C
TSCKNQTTIHGMDRARPKQPINKTIGINKLGTLLSSQTTDTPGTTTTSQPWIAPEQLLKLTGWLPTCQTGVRDLHQPEAFVSIFPSDSVEQRGNKLYHHFSGMATAPARQLPRPQPRETKKPGISRDSGLFCRRLRRAGSH